MVVTHVPNPRIDETDRRILRYLLRDARQPVAVLARQIGLSESAVRHRIDRLTELEIIRRFTIAVDWKKLGYPITVVVGVKVVGMPGPEAAKALRQVNEIVDIFTVTGEFDLILRIVCSDIERFEEIVERVRAYEFVEQTRSFVVLNRIRENDFDSIIELAEPRSSTRGAARA
jgi:DNA-binding Lrp family transcriptional regulator